MTDVFISYATEDRSRVQPIAEALMRQGFSVWWDRKIVAGQQFDQAIEQALDTAKCVVVCWSTHSIGSEWVKNEAASGAERNVLVPLFLDDVRLPLEFRRRQTVSLVGWNADEAHPGFAGLCEGIRAVLIGTSKPSDGKGVDSGVRRDDDGPVVPTHAVARGAAGQSRRFWLGAVIAGIVILAIGIGGFIAYQRSDDSTGRTPDGRVAKLAAQPVTAQIVVEGTTRSHGVFTPSGDVLAMAHGVDTDRRRGVEVVWQADGQTRRSAAIVARRAALADGVVLLKLRSSSGQRYPFPVRIAATLQPGEPVQRYLTDSDRAPGTVKQLFGEMTVHGNDGPVKVDRLLITTQIAGPGDSGAPVLDARGNIVGLVYGASQTETVSIMIEDVKASFPEAFN